MKFLYLGFASSDYMVQSFIKLASKNNKVMMVFTEQNLILKKNEKDINKYPISIHHLNFKNFNTILKKIKKFKPDTILIPNYHSLIFRYFCFRLKSKNIVFIICQDHYWTGSIKQIIGRIISKIYLHTIAKTILIPFKSAGHLKWALEMKFKKKISYLLCIQPTIKFINIEIIINIKIVLYLSVDLNMLKDWIFS